jgi:hypothetical protein
MGNQAMTEADYYELLFMTFDSMIGSFGLLLSILFAFLATAFFIGSRLTRFQAMVVSFLFIFGATIMVAGTYGVMQRALGFVEHLRKLDPDEFFMMSATFANALLALMVLSIPVSLYFLYQIRSNPQLGATSQ